MNLIPYGRQNISNEDNRFPKKSINDIDKEDLIKGSKAIIPSPPHVDLCCTHASSDIMAQNFELVVDKRERHLLAVFGWRCPSCNLGAWGCFVQISRWLMLGSREEKKNQKGENLFRKFSYGSAHKVRMYIAF